MKKVFLSLGTLAIALVALPMFSAFEAHIINVTAQIENALAVDTDAINFGTVFPQEHLNQPLGVTLSSSFMAEDGVTGVHYQIRQKPKCAWTLDNGTNMLGLPTATGEVYPGTMPAETQYGTQFDGYYVVCPDPGNPLRPNGAEYGLLPSLCEYISKEPDDPQGNDDTTPSFHQPWTIVNNAVEWLNTNGELTKGDEVTPADTTDDWNIDLAVPCFGGACAQDWDEFVHGINPSADPAAYEQDAANEHKVFGCDLWVEVTGVDRPLP